MNIRSIQNILFPAMAVLTLVPALIFGIACSGCRQASPEADSGKPGKILGVAFETIQVSNLERSVDFYRAIGFTPVGDTDPPWIKDETQNRLYKTPGARSRTATLMMPTIRSGRWFALYLREYDGVERGGRVDFPARDPSSPHIGLIEPEADAVWENLRSAGLLRPLSWDGKLIRQPGQTSGGLAYVRDPDGFNIEIIGMRQESSNGLEPPNSPTFHHMGLVVMNYDKCMSFYGNLLGARFPEALGKWVSGDNYDAVVGGHGYVIRLTNGMFPEAAAPQASMPFELVEYQKPNREKIEDYGYSDIAVNCVGIQVEGLRALYSRLKDAGIETWSEGGIVQRKDHSRAVVVRDPDVGAFVELFEKPQE